MKIFQFTLLPIITLLNINAYAGEDLLGYLKGAETLPQHGLELYQILTLRNDKGQGSHNAYDYKTEVEYGVTNSLSTSISVMAQKVIRSGLVVNGYLPEQTDSGNYLSGLEFEVKYNFLSPAKDDFGLSGSMALVHNWKDKHSGVSKKTTSLEMNMIMQKYFLEGEAVWHGLLGTESTYADRSPLSNASPEFEWSTSPEVELELKAGTGLSYRFIPKWYLGGEVLYETEFETDVGQERWSYFAGPSLHYGSESWWTTLTWFKQLSGGGEEYKGQKSGYHLIEKTKNEVKLKVGFNF